MLNISPLEGWWCGKHSNLKTVFKPFHYTSVYQVKKKIKYQWMIQLFFKSSMIYKGHMYKIKGEGRSGGGRGFSWGGVEGWGEKAYNCN